MPFPVLIFVGGAVTSSIIGAGIAYFQSRNPYNPWERVENVLNKESEALDTAFDLARDPLRRDPEVIRNHLEVAHYGYTNEYFPANHCVGPKISNLERLLEQGGDTGNAIGDLMSGYYPGFHDAIGKTCHSLNRRSVNKAKYKLPYLMYDLYHAVFADIWELAFPYIVAETSTTMKLVKVGCIFDHSNSSKKLTNTTSIIEYVKNNPEILLIVTFTLYITYLIGRYLVNNQIPDLEEISYVLKQGFLSIFAALHPFFFLLLRVTWRLLCHLSGEDSILPRTTKAWKAVRNGRESYFKFMNETWSGCFEVFILGPLRIAKERGFENLTCCLEDIEEVVRRFIEISQVLFREGAILPFQDFCDHLFHRGTYATAHGTEEGNTLLEMTLPFHLHND